MKVAPLIAVALILCIAFPCQIQAKKKPKPKFCVGKDGNQYSVGQGYDDNDGKACTHYKCVKKKKKFVMKKGKCVEDGEWSSWSSWSACSSTCGSATKTRKRTCSSPAPSNGGHPCSGPEKEIEECSNPSCGPDMNVKVDSLELNVQSLNDSVQTLQTTMLSVLELITTMQSAANKQGTCMSDLTSSDCPPSAAGKTGVVDGIAANTDDIRTSKAGIASNRAEIVSNKEGVNSNNDTCSSIQAITTKLETCLDDVYSASCPSSEGGKTSIPDAIMKNKDAIEAHHSDTTTTITPTSPTTTTAASSTTTAGCEMVNTNFHGNDIPGGISTQTDWQNCQNKCQTNPKCTHWTFRNSDGNCYLKAGTKNQSKENGLVSGPRDCSDPCPTGWTYLANSCYQLVKSAYAVSYQGAMLNCKNENGYLVEMNTQEEQDALIQFLKDKNVDEHVWLGGTDEEQTGKWIGGHSGEEIMKFNGWATGHPSHVGSQHCILTHPNRQFKWNDYWCDSDSQGYNPKAALCEYDITPTITPTSTTTTTAASSTTTAVLWLASNTETIKTLKLPEFTPGSCKVSNPDMDLYWSDIQEIQGKLYSCDHRLCQIYNKEDNTWKTIPGKKFKFQRMFSAGTVIGDKWIVQGGRSGSGNSPNVKTAEVWSPGTGNWEEAPQYKSPLPVRSACLLNINGKIMQIGGYEEEKHVETNKCFLDGQEIASLKFGRNGPACAVFLGEVWVAGGNNYQRDCGIVEIYDSSSNKWKEGAKLPEEIKRDWTPKLIPYEGHLYYVGGEQSSKMYKLNLNKFKWDEVGNITKGWKSGHIVNTYCEGLLHTDANYEYYKVPVPASSKMTSAVVLTTCIKLGMKPQCFRADYADSNCVQAPRTSIHSVHPRGMSQILCGTNTNPQDCASTLNMFWYMKNWESGSACGATKDGGFCSEGKDYTSTSDMQYFAACLKPVTTDWTLIQHRGQFGNAEDYFYKDFKDYEDGFGSVDGELWIGLKNLTALTKDGEWELQVDLTDWDDKKYHAKYATFSVGPAPTYKLHVGGFKDGESTLGDSLAYHDGQAFSARDKDQDLASSSCASINRGGWWYKRCQYVNLNGLNFAQQKDDAKGMRWWNGKDRGISNKTWKASVMKIKRMKV